jgi:hypothetical protein
MIYEEAANQIRPIPPHQAMKRLFGSLRMENFFCHIFNKVLPSLVLLAASWKRSATRPAVNVMQFPCNDEAFPDLVLHLQSLYRP